MWDIVCISPQGHGSVSVSRHFLLQAPQWPWSVWKWFSRDHCCRGRSKPGCQIVGLHTRWELTTWADFQLCLHRYKSLYLANDTRYRHSYYGRRIGTRMRSIKWCHFQWPWTNPNPVFKVTPLFDAKYLANGYRYGYSYYSRQIGNRTQSFEWHQFYWPWVTSKPDFKVTVLYNVK